MRAWQITLKDLRLLGKDLRALVILLALPLVFISILGMATSKLMVKTESVQAESVENLEPGKIVYQELVPSYTVMFAFFLVNIMARSFLAEKELGTFRRLWIAPISPFELLIGKTLPFLIVSLVQCLLLFVCGRLLFGMSWGAEPWLLVPIVCCMSLAATALGLMVATWVKTDAQVSAYGNLLVISMAGVSGCFMPRDWLPPMMQNISLVTPHAWSLIAFEQVLSSTEIDYGKIATSCAVLCGFAVLFVVSGWMIFRKSQ